MSAHQAFGGGTPPSDEGSVARTVADAAAVAELMAHLLDSANIAAGGDPATARRLLVARLLRRRPEDGHLLDVLRWFAATHDLDAALAATRRMHAPEPEAE